MVSIDGCGVGDSTALSYDIRSSDLVRPSTLAQVTESRDPGGFTEASLLEAIRRSGYPLQGRVIELITRTFGDWGFFDAISEEWPFVDPDTGQTRHLDLLVRRRLRGVNDDVETGDPGIPLEARALLRHEVDFLIECKQSALPYVFFTRPKVYPREMPLVLGAPHEEIQVGYVGEEPYATMELADIVAYSADPEPPDHVASVAAKASYKKGGDLELSGDDIFRGLTLPLRKALKHYQSLCNEPYRLYRDVRYTYPLVVLDAPMYAYDNSTLSRVDAVRVTFNEPAVDAWHSSFNADYSIDFVSIDHLAEFLLAGEIRSTEIARRLDSIAIVAVTGEGSFRGDREESPDSGNSSDDPLHEILPPMNKDEEAAWLQARFIEVHNQAD